MKFEISSSRAYTIMEMTIASALLILVALSIAMLFITGLRLFERGVGQTNVQRRARVALDNIARAVRAVPSSASIFIFNSYTDRTVNMQGDYIELNNAGYYFSGTKIRFIADLSADNQGIETDDKPIVDGTGKVGGATIFTNNGADMITIQFSVTDQSVSRGNQSANFITSVYKRN